MPQNRTIQQGLVRRRKKAVNAPKKQRLFSANEQAEKPTLIPDIYKNKMSELTEEVKKSKQVKSKKRVADHFHSSTTKATPPPLTSL